MSYAQTDLSNVLATASCQIEHLQLTENLVVNPSNAAPLNSTLYVNGTMVNASATVSTAIFQPFVQFTVSENLSQTPLSGSSIDGLNVNHNVTDYGGGAAGQGSRTGINVILTMSAPTTGDNSQSKFYSAITGQCTASHNDGGSSNVPSGNYYGISGIAILEGKFNASEGIHAQSLIGAELDVSAGENSSVSEKIILQLVSINYDAKQGSNVDAGIVMCGDATTSAAFDFGIAFGKPGSLWNIANNAEASRGTIIGTYPTINARTAFNGVDFSDVTFSGHAFRSDNFSVAQSGLVAGTQFLSTPAAMSNAFQSPNFQVTDTGLVAASYFLGGQYALAPVSAPVSIPGQFLIYMDSATNALMAVGPSGTRTTLALP